MEKDISLRNIVKSFDGVKVLKNINLDIKDGEIFSILGPSGCGKTTLLRMIAGFTDPDEGVIYLGDQDITKLPPNERNVNTIFQKYALFPHLSVYENVAFPLKLKKVDKDIIDEEVKKFIKLVGLSEHIDKMPNQLSGGQQQRVSIARALINKPGVLLLDEPLSALDAKLRQNLLIELDLIHEEVGITFIFITHDQQEALSISDRIAVMNQGEILQIGTPAEVYESPADAFVADFIGENNFFDGTVTEVLNGTFARLHNNELGDLVFEMDKPVKVGDRVKVSIRPEKIKLYKNMPTIANEMVNVLKVYVNEVIYSGFQSKYFVFLNNNKELPFKVFKQHAVYFDDNDEDVVWWDEDAYIAWDADDGFLVEVISDEKN
ncbi:Spermidine/putrescine import ATP-binding protein PotA [Fusobacterium sp. DD29]|uniref:ABC transporter ATP-binding protein n=1 Tax=unclassified Fusobacterium TaxID=2648384 RepID=UPI001B8C734D|nr:MULTISPECIES: ABC transporter ATP-binding protein [unclassified Fusobacterium]MBR8700462.1 Spermidine/putrescine import ATP-binding protein PotA [Fusobacterium sp. DD45]MBR8710211.1 Spermidine/putrescine import ATP-binding protein PotA [Fusobacterium sp. DD28]MBR8750258.1 Spermidine/putrescine import ATP-binding protein PotA [Fusobacterium sp. DD29]MBR8750688.1 Spermidine/putrescine import ATP-binding protein PotA [Fusobacterium sp. DD26]MBR8762499.1 Spermidine/putrescine import ATP-binding